MQLPPALERLSELKHATVIGVVLTFAVDLGILVGLGATNPPGAYIILMIGLVVLTFLIPYLFGIRQGKMLVVIGIVIFLLVGALNGPIVVHRSYSMSEPDPVYTEAFYDWTLQTSEPVEGDTYFYGAHWYSLDDGRLAPYKDQPGTFNFTVTVVSDANYTNPPDIRVGYIREVWLNVEEEQMHEQDPLDTNYTDGKIFNCTVAIQEKAIYHHWFGLALGPGSLNTSVAMGPLVGGEADLYGFYAGIGTISMFCNIGMLFVIVVLLYWWLGSAKERRKRWDDALREHETTKDEEEILDELEKRGKEEKEPAREPEEGEFTCTECGAPVSASHNFCPNCGERFDGVEGSEGSVEKDEGAKGEG